MQQNKKGHSVFAREKLQKGEIICTYDGKVCTYKELSQRKQEYMLSGAGSHILEFKFQEKWWGIDTTKDDCSMGHLINHSKQNAECQACVKSKRGQANH